tara:strand:+ start:867 stop:1256 length:390 start_codon:yes stop_codon:yes gene_type:complete
MEDIIVKIDGKEHKVKVEETDEGKIKVHFNGEIYEVETKADIQDIEDIGDKKGDVEKGGENTITAPLPGIVAVINVKKGQKVNSDDVLLKIIAMKMENEVLSPKSGVVKEIKVKKNDNVNKGDVLVVIE